jgi:hypothetical protein
MASGLRATVTVASLNQDFGSDIATVRNALNRFKQRYDSYWAPYGESGYLALGGIQGDADELGSAISETLALYQILHGTATVAADGTVTLNTTGHDFTVLINRVCGDSVN